jgi:hypothetical protein
MPKLPRPFWQVLLIILGDNPSEKLTCEEWTAMMEYLADRAIEGATIEDLKLTANALFRFCTECKDHYQRHIQELETKIVLKKSACV